MRIAVTRQIKLEKENYCCAHQRKTFFSNYVAFYTVSSAMIPAFWIFLRTRRRYQVFQISWLSIRHRHNWHRPTKSKKRHSDMRATCLAFLHPEQHAAYRKRTWRNFTWTDKIPQRHCHPDHGLSWDLSTVKAVQNLICKFEEIGDRSLSRRPSVPGRLL